MGRLVQNSSVSNQSSFPIVKISEDFIFSFSLSEPRRSDVSKLPFFFGVLFFSLCILWGDERFFFVYSFSIMRIYIVNAGVMNSKFLSVFSRPFLQLAQVSNLTTLCPVARR